ADMRAPLSRFTGLPHRLEWVRTLNQVDFFNDSKGTNTGAVQKSLRGFDRPLILIMGGRAKGADFSPLAPLLKGRVKHLILMGEARSEIRSILNGSFGYQDADSMEDAVRLAWTQAAPGDVVLLSPGCASFDMFRDFEDRGERFKACVNRL
ncbi:MAG: glutamate ligase domain-containing protein, partial [Nitrospinaceae bacterium]